MHMSSNVKSAIRVLEILEYLDSIRREAGVTEIARELNYPISSTSMLLQSLAERGYLEQNSKRTYRMTPRVTLLGSWVAPNLSANGDVVAMMEEIGKQCGAAIVLAVPTSAAVRYIHVVPATKTVRMHVSPGATRPLVNSGFGRLFLAGMPEESIRQAVFRHNSHLAEGETPVSLKSFQKNLEAIRATGHAVSVDQATPGAGVVAVRLPDAATDLVMGVGIGAPSELIRMHADEYATLIKDCIQRFIPTPLR
jgi:IclR family acetate operon transcriptional repressor